MSRAGRKLSGYSTSLPSIRFKLNNKKARIEKERRKNNSNNNNTFIISICIWSYRTFYNTCETSSPLSGRTRERTTNERTIPASSFLNLNPLGAKQLPLYSDGERREKTCTSLPHTRPSITQWTREAQAQSHTQTHFRFHSFAQGTGLHRESITVVTIVSVCCFCCCCCCLPPIRIFLSLFLSNMEALGCATAA